MAKEVQFRPRSSEFIQGWEYGSSGMGHKDLYVAVQLSMGTMVMYYSVISAIWGLGTVPHHIQLVPS